MEAQMDALERERNIELGRIARRRLMECEWFIYINKK